MNNLVLKNNLSKLFKKLTGLHSKLPVKVPDNNNHKNKNLKSNNRKVVEELTGELVLKIVVIINNKMNNLYNR